MLLTILIIHLCMLLGRRCQCDWHCFETSGILFLGVSRRNFRIFFS